PNGAGKTSTIRMITCVSPPSRGELRVAGFDVARQPRAIKSRIGVVPQDDNLDPDLTVEENLRSHARFFGIERRIREQRIAESLELFQLAERRSARVDELSGGMKRRLVIARALLNEPEMVVLDEPTTGLDPQARHVVWQKLRILRGRGITLLLTTHYMDEAAILCDRIAIMDQGRIVAEGSPSELIARHAGTEVVELRVPPGQAIGLAQHLSRMSDLDVEATGDTVYVFDTNGLQAVAILEHLETAHAVSTRPANLEDVFLRLTGRALEE
ncbi:MAG TPA: ABC transporter ATP-binding protein, partial [Dehalococcoidia bacterium]|nr:ABC transporter ATP-binding protein [Dehalococcoidia bacterium]